MNKAQQGVQGVRTFFQEVWAELKKCAWPTGRELRESSIVVIIAVLLLAAYIGLCDSVMMFALHALTGR
ncbi:MAG: preprotein translocase subunit SecE [Kiritimatiellae bacterium]|nr:preprotein translocase subunit SecE [Kiritimatiellia bacterium]